MIAALLPYWGIAARNANVMTSNIGTSNKSAFPNATIASKTASHYYVRPHQELSTGDWKASPRYDYKRVEHELPSRIRAQTPFDSDYMFLALDPALEYARRTCLLRLRFDGTSAPFQSGADFQATVRLRFKSYGAPETRKLAGQVALVVSLFSGDEVLGKQRFSPAKEGVFFDERTFCVSFNGYRVADANDLRLQFVGEISQGQRWLQVSWAEVDVSPSIGPCSIRSGPPL